MKRKFVYNEVKKFSTIREMMDIAVADAGDKDIYRWLEKKEIKSVTYREFQITLNYLGTALASLGLSKSHVATSGENSYKWACTYLTMLQSEGVFVPVDKELPIDDMINVLNQSDAEAIFYASKFEDIFHEREKDLPNIKYFIGFDRAEDEGKFLSYDKLMEKGKKLVAEGDRSYLDQVPDPNALKMLVYTSGTTGDPKGVMLSEHNLVSMVYYGMRVSKPETTELAVLPFHHTYEAVPGILVSIHKHNTMCINQKLTQVLKNMQVFKPDYMYIVPAFAELFYKKIWAAARESGKEKGLKMLIHMSNALRKVGIDKRRKLFKSILDSFGGELRTLICGGAPVRAELGYFFDSIGIYLMNGYGITECAPLISVNRFDMDDCTTVGFVLPCLELKFDDVTDEGIGEICVKGDNVMLGYYKRPELTEEVLKDGWFSTGDYGMLDKEGRLKITGRKKNIIVLTNGKNIYPEELEEKIGNIDYVKEAVVYAVLDENGAEDGLCAEAFLDEDMVAAMNEPDIKARLKKDIDSSLSELPRYKQISEIVIRDKEFVKNSSNKIKRNLVGPNAK